MPRPSERSAHPPPPGTTPCRRALLPHRPACGRCRRTNTTRLGGWLKRRPADRVLVEWTPDEPVQVTAGPCRTTSLYLATDGTALHGSWEMGDLSSFAGGLNAREVTRLLLYRPRYSTNTAFTGIHRLTERTTAHFGGALFSRHPESALHSGPRGLAYDADVLGAFGQAMDDAWDTRPLETVTTTVRLSGLDSGVLATRAAAPRLHPRQRRVAQPVRRAAVPPVPAADRRTCRLRCARCGHRSGRRLDDDPPPEGVPVPADGRSVRRRAPVRRAAYRAELPAIRRSAAYCARPVRRCAGAFSSGALRVPAARHRLSTAGMRRVSPRLSSATAPRAGLPRLRRQCPALPRPGPGPAAPPGRTAGPHCRPGHRRAHVLTRRSRRPAFLRTASRRRAAIPAWGRARTGPVPLARMADAASPRSPVRGCTALASRCPAPALGVDRSDGGSPAGHREAPPPSPCYFSPIAGFILP